MNDNSGTKPFVSPSSSSAGTAEIIKNLTTLPTTSPNGELLDIVSPSPSPAPPGSEDQPNSNNNPAPEKGNQ